MIIQLRALNVTGGGGDNDCLDGKAMSSLRCENECRECAVIIQWRSLIGRGGGREDNCLGGSGREDDCIDDSVLIQLRAFNGVC